MELQDLCMGCMAETGGAAVCPQCGFAESQATTGGGLYLPPRTVLNGRYVIGRVLGQGGCWLTTPAWLRSAYRDFYVPTDHVSFMGFRLARSL